MVRGEKIGKGRREKGQRRKRVELRETSGGDRLFSVEMICL